MGTASRQMTTPAPRGIGQASPGWLTGRGRLVVGVAAAAAAIALALSQLPISCRCSLSYPAP